MWRMVFYFVLIAAAALSLAWVADRPGAVTVTWLDYEIETSLLVGVGGLFVGLGALWASWSLLRGLVGAPGMVFGILRVRRQRLGYEALSRGMLAAGAGDLPAAQKFSVQAGRWLADEPLTLLLKAQAAQLKGDEATAERLFNSMLQMPETELLGLHGLFVQASRRKDNRAAHDYAAQAFARKPGLLWAARAVLTSQSAAGDWPAAEKTLALCADSALIDRQEVQRKQAVLLCAQASALEENDDTSALDFAKRAHKLAPELVPAAVIAGRILAAQGYATRAARVLAKTWRLSPHPDIAEIYGAAHSGATPRDRLKRIRMLLKKADGGREGALALAMAAVEAQDWRQARAALTPLLNEHLSARVCALMADVEEGEFGDKGRVREWLARAVNAPRDPVWTADGIVSEIWLPVSPVTGELDRFEWKVPLESIGPVLRGPDAAGLEDMRLEMASQDSDGVREPETGDSDAADVATSVDNGGGDTPSPQLKDTLGDTRSSGTDGSDPVIFVAPPAPDDPGSQSEKKPPRGWLRSLLP